MWNTCQSSCGCLREKLCVCLSVCASVTLNLCMCMCPFVGECSWLPECLWVITQCVNVKHVPKFVWVSEREISWVYVCLCISDSKSVYVYVSMSMWGWVFLGSWVSLWVCVSECLCGCLCGCLGILVGHVLPANKFASSHPDALATPRNIPFIHKNDFRERPGSSFVWNLFKTCEWLKIWVWKLS